MERYVHKSMQGKEVDMAALVAKHEAMPAIGNVRMNARGDELGPGGQVIKKKEEVVNAHYNQGTNQG